jgi:hypothetical protein
MKGMRGIRGVGKQFLKSSRSLMFDIMERNHPM